MQRFKPYTINIRRRLIDVSRPLVMGIINVTPDSFFDGSRTPDADRLRRRVQSMIDDGADMIDVGGYSSRPGADDVSESEELDRVGRGIEIVREISGDIPVSVDTFRSRVACEAVTSLGADIINDISGGDLDPAMFDTVARTGAPYILMHMRGTPTTMQTLTDYDNVITDVTASLAAKILDLRSRGVADIIADPGFGFSKTPDQNYRLLAGLSYMIHTLDCPMLVGVSRKSMITRPLGITAAEALPATQVLHTLAIMQGASILRVHDVKEARQAVTLTSLYLKSTL